MKYRPILFSTAMVQAIMNGTKTQTRRIIKPEPFLNKNYFNGKLVREFYSIGGVENQDDWIKLKAKAQVNDVFWVRETCKVGAWRDEEFKVAFDYRASPELIRTDWCEFQDIDRFREFHQKILKELDDLGIEPTIDEEAERFYYKWDAGQSPFRWKPSIFMPKEACRNFLETTKVRVERVQDISEDDAIAEGIEEIHPAPFLIRWKNYLKEKDYFENPIDSFKSLWISINGQESWDANPYVFAYDFNKIDKPKDFV